MAAPITFQWNGEAMVPHPRYMAQCNRAFAVGENYPLIVHEERSGNSHRHYFAAVHDAWLNLPDDLALNFRTSEHLRKWALIQAGYASERTIACSSREEARKVAAFIKPMDEYAVVLVRGDCIKVFTAESQSHRNMGKKRFQESKDKVLEILSGLIGVKPAELSAQVGQAA